MTAYTPAQVEHFKDQAKRISRMRQISHSTALDEVAVAHGFNNWQLLVRASKPRSPDITSPEVAFRLVRTDEGWRAALRKVSGANALQPSGFADLRSVCADFASPVEAVRFSQDYLRRLLARPRFWVRPDSQVMAEMRWWLPYSVHEVDDNSDVRLLLNRHYKPVGTIGREFVEYSDFPHLHLSSGLQALRSFSWDDEGSGFLYNDGTAPWLSRTNADAYLHRLRALETACASPPMSDLPWRREHQDVYDVLHPWARVSTWFTGHGHDERRLREVVDQFRRWRERPSEDVLRVALSRHRDENLELLGGKASARHVHQFAARIRAMLGEG